MVLDGLTVSMTIPVVNPVPFLCMTQNYLCRSRDDYLVYCTGQANYRAPGQRESGRESQKMRPCRGRPRPGREPGAGKM
jgi:hypothetical protein